MKIKTEGEIERESEENKQLNGFLSFLCLQIQYPAALYNPIMYVYVN